MTIQEILQRQDQFSQSRHKNVNELIAFVRGLVPVLKDHNAHASAAELSRLLFVLDVEEKELNNLYRSLSPIQIVELLILNQARNTRPK